MAQHFVNAAPQNVQLGINDRSTRQVTPEPEALPSHLPKFYIWAADGSTEPQLVVGSSLVATYGMESFDIHGPYYNHASLYLTEINAEGNAVMVERLRPDDAGVNAYASLYLDVLETEVPEYKRNADGTYSVDEFGKPIETGNTIQGFKVVHRIVDQGQDFVIGQSTERPGLLTDDSGTVQSRMYPIMDLEVPHFGKKGNNKGFRIFSPHQNSNQGFDVELMRRSKQYPYRMACLQRADEHSVGRIVNTISDEPSLDVVFKKGTLNHRTTRLVGIEDLFIQSYQDLNNPIYPDWYGPFGDVHVYQSTIDTLTKQFYDVEALLADEHSDFTLEEGEEGLFNLIGGHSSTGVPYHSFVVDKEDPEGVVMSENSVIYAINGSDGTMDDESFANLVGERISEYNNPNSPLMDDARYPESIIWDSGFPLETKYKLLNFIARRKDTFVVLSTHVDGGPRLTASEDSSLAQTLKTYAKLYPESEFYGTGVARVMIVGRSGDYTRVAYNKPVSLSLEVAVKAARYMGASNGIWDSEARFSGAPGSIVEYFTNVSSSFTPASVRNKDWDNGLVWVQSYERKSLFFPAFKTVYDDDTSVLNSFFTAMACVELQKIGNRAWRDVSGIDYLTNEQIIERNNKNIINRTTGRFDDRFIIVPETYYTKADEQRGFSFHHKIKIYAPNMKTVSVFTVEAYRRDDFNEAEA